MTHFNLNTIYYTHVERSPTKTTHTKHHTERQTIFTEVTSDGAQMTSTGYPIYVKRRRCFLFLFGVSYLFLFVACPPILKKKEEEEEEEEEKKTHFQMNVFI